MTEHAPSAAAPEPSAVVEDAPPSLGVLRLATPLVISFCLRAAFAWVDTAYASRLEGLADASIAAIGLTFPFEFLMIACWVGSSNALTSRLSAAMGARQGEKVDQLVRASRRLLWGVTALFVAVAAGIWLAAPHVGLEPTLARQFQVYGTVLVGGSAFTSFWSVIPDSIVKAHHDTRSTMWAGLLSTFTNVALNTLFVFAFHWGIFGIALSTVIGRLAGLAYAVGRARHHESLRRAAGRDTRPGLFERPVGALLALGLPASASFVLMSVEGFAVNGILARSADAEASIAAWALFDQAARFLLMPVIATGVALLPLSARLFGAGDLGRIRAELRTATVAAVAYTLLFVLPAALLFGPWLADVLVESPTAREHARLGLRVVAVAVVAAAPTFLLRSTFEGMQRPRPGLIASLARTVGLVVPLSFLGARLAPRLGHPVVVGVYAGWIAGAALASLGFLLWARRRLTA